MADHKKGRQDSRQLRQRAEAKATADEAKIQEPLTSEAARRVLHELRVHQIELEMQNEELRRAQEELETSQARYFDLYDMAPVGYFTLSKPGLILEANLTAAALLGVTRDALVKQPLTRFIFREDQDIYYRHCRQLFETGLPQVCQMRMLRAAADSFWVRLEATVFQDSDGVACGRAVIIDITERQQMEEVQIFLAQTSSSASREGFFGLLAKYLAKSLGMDFVCIDRLEGDGLNARTVAVWSDGQFEDNVTYALKDTPCGDVVGKEVCCFPASVCRFFPHDQVLRDLRAESYVGVTLWSRTGQPIGLIAVIGRHPLANRSRVEAVLKMVAMRTAGELEQQESEQRLHANEERYRTILQTAMDGFWMTDMQGRIQEVNETYCQMSGYSMQEMLAMHITDLEAGETAGETAAHIQKVLIQGKDRFTSRHRRKDGSTYYVEVSVQFRPAEGGQLVAFLRDVSSQKLMEDRILSISRFPEENPQPILRLSLDGTITYSNIPGEMLLKHWGLHVGQVAPEEWCKWVTETLDSGKNKENVVDLGQIVFLIILVPIREGRYVNLYGRDITKQRQYEESLRQSRDNLQTLVEVRTQDLAHSVMRLQEEIRERHIAEEELHQNHLKLKMLAARVEFAEEQERRRIASDLHDSVGQILAFTIREIQAMRKVAPKKLSGSLHELSDQLDKAVEQTRTLSFNLSPNILYDIGFEVAVEDLTERFAKENQIRCCFENCGSPKILTDPVKVLLYRSIRELLINIAKHAEAEVAEVALKRIGDQLRITVRDDGRGFAITEDGKSKGFGLFSIRERMYHIGGRLEMESAKGHGTTITLIVPLSIEDEGRNE